jgi:DNA-binding CsgD family transcriptional regulator
LIPCGLKGWLAARVMKQEAKTPRQLVNGRTRHDRDGARWFSPARGLAMLGEESWAQVSRSLNLSERELQIMRAVFEDRTEFAIAAELGISSHTVHTHFRRLHKKLGAVTRVQLVLRAIDEVLVLSSRSRPSAASPPRAE